MLELGKQKIISKCLGVSHAMVSLTLRGERGSRGSDLQDKILKTSYELDKIVDKANIEIVQYCERLRMESPLTPEGKKSPLTPEGGTAGASYIRVMEKVGNNKNEK